MGRFEEAARENELARQLDPLHMFDFNAGLTYLLWRRCDHAMDYFQHAIDMEPESFWGYEGRAFALTCKAEAAIVPGYREGKWPEGPDSQKALTPAFQKQMAAAIPDYEKAVTLADSPFTEAYLGEGYGWAGRPADAMRVIEKLREWSKHRYVPSWAFMRIYCGLGDREETFRWLEVAYRDRSFTIPQLKVDTAWFQFRSDPRFIAMLKKVGLDK